MRLFPSLEPVPEPEPKVFTDEKKIAALDLYLAGIDYRIIAMDLNVTLAGLRSFKVVAVTVQRFMDQQMMVPEADQPANARELWQLVKAAGFTEGDPVLQKIGTVRVLEVKEDKTGTFEQYKEWTAVEVVPEP